MDTVQKSFIILTLAASIFLMSVSNAYAAKIPTFTAKVGESKLITFKLTNSQIKEAPYVYLIQVKNGEDFTDQLSWVSGQIQLGQEIRPQQSWIPAKPGEYTVNIFVWGSLDNPSSLSPHLTMKVIVEE